MSLKHDGTDGADQPNTVDMVTWSRFDGTGWWDRRDASSLWQHGSCSVRRMRADKT